MTTRVSPVTSIRGHVCERTRPFSYVNPGNNKSEPLIPFGFLGWVMCGNNSKDVFQNAARQALEREATNSGVHLTTRLLPELRLIEQQVRNSYPGTGTHNTLDDVQLMQIAVDTCLFLLVAFTMFLGDTLGFPSQHLLFGHGRVNENKEMWLQSIYFVGNQIPFLMVDKLMGLFSSLRGYRTRLMRVRNVLPSCWLKIALHKFVTSDSHSSTPPPFDVIDCLRLIVLGPPVTNNQFPSIFSCKGKLGTVSEHSKQGYSYLPLPPESGVRGIRSENTVLLGVKVYLPPMEINSEQRLELMANCLVQYEATHGLQPEVEHYLNSLCSLIRSPEDVQLLLSAKVIDGLKVDSLPKVLERFHERPIFDPNCQRIDILARRPRILLVQTCMKPLKWLLGGVFAINAIYFVVTHSLQSLYTVLAYYKQGSQGPSP